MSDHNNPPGPLLPYERTIKFHPQVSSIDEDFEASAPASMPFYYASFVGIWVYWLTDLENVAPHFTRDDYQGDYGDGFQSDFQPYVFEGADGRKKALTVINFQTYTSHAGMALGTVNEVEFNICAYPTADRDRVPMGLSVKDFMMGVDQTKRIGLFRIHVPADNTIAVAAGRGFFGEPKFFAQFWYMIPALNLQSQKTWNVYVFDRNAEGVVGARNPPDSKDNLIFHMAVPKIDVMPEYANTSPLALYTYVNGIPNGSHWQMLLPMENYSRSDGNADLFDAVTMEAGNSPKENMAADVRALIGGSKPVGIQIFRSNPACIEGGAYDVR